MWIVKAIKDIKDVDILFFKNDSRKFIITLLDKLIEKSPLRFKLVQGVSCLSPTILKLPELCKKRAKLALEEFVDTKRMTSIDADNVLREFSSIVPRQHVQEQLKKFDCQRVVGNAWMNF